MPPKAPPTSGAITRIAVSGNPSTTARSARARCGVCVASHTVRSSVAASHAANAARGSIALGDRRACCTFTRTTTSSGRGSGAACGHVWLKLPASGAVSADVSTITNSAASMAACNVSATTATTGCPTASTCSRANTFSGAGSNVSTSGLTAVWPHSDRSSAVNTPLTPGIARAATVSMTRIRPHCCPRTKTTWRQPGIRMSPTNRPSPRSNAASSRRNWPRPTHWPPPRPPPSSVATVTAWRGRGRAMSGIVSTLNCAY